MRAGFYPLTNTRTYWFVTCNGPEDMPRLTGSSRVRVLGADWLFLVRNNGERVVGSIGLSLDLPGGHAAASECAVHTARCMGDGWMDGW